jgi:hypothetical protein
MAETNFINKIYIHATGETALPTLPSKGANITSYSGAVAIGSRQGGDGADLDSESVTVTLFDEFGEVMAPRSLTREDMLYFANGVDTVEFTAYDGSEALLTLASTFTVAANVLEPTAATTKRTVAIEVNGLWVDYFPSCVVAVTQFSGAYAGDKSAVSKTTFTVRPCATMNQPGGWERHYYQS